MGFLAGAAVRNAGKLVVQRGRLVQISPHSGHYRPGRRSVAELLHFLRDSGVDLDTVQIDMQRLHVRPTAGANEPKLRKALTTRMEKASTALTWVELKLEREATDEHLGALVHESFGELQSQHKNICK